MRFTKILSLLVFVILSVSCVRGKRSKCPILTKDLDKPHRVEQALKDIGDLKCKMSLDKLHELFKQGKYRMEILKTVKQIKWHPYARKYLDKLKQKNEDGTPVLRDIEKKWAEEAVDILRMGLQDRDVAAVTAGIIGEWKVLSLKDALVKALMRKDYMKIRSILLKALLKIITPEDKNKKDEYIANLKSIEDILIELLKSDPNAQGIYTNVLAAEKLGEIKSVKAIPYLINGIWLRTSKNEKMYQKARVALVEIGEPAFLRLLDTLEGKNEEVKKFAEEYGISEWEWKDGPELIQVIGDFRDRRAAMPLINKQAQKIVPPPGLSEEQLNQWKQAQNNRITVTMLALGVCGTNEIIPKAVEIIEDPDNDIKQILDTATTLALMGTPEAQDALMKIFKKSKNSKFKASLLVSLSLALDYDHYQKFKKILRRERAKIIKVFLKENVQVRDNFALLEECKDNFDCYKKKLKTLDPRVAQKAALEIGKKTKGVKEDIDLLFDRFKSSKAAHTDLRSFILITLQRLMFDKPKKDVEYFVSKVKKLYSKEKEKSSAANKYWASELKILLIAWQNKLDAMK